MPYSFTATGFHRINLEYYINISIALTILSTIVVLTILEVLMNELRSVAMMNLPFFLNVSMLLRYLEAQELHQPLKVLWDQPLYANWVAPVLLYKHHSQCQEFFSSMFIESL